MLKKRIIRIVLFLLLIMFLCIDIFNVANIKKIITYMPYTTIEDKDAIMKKASSDDDNAPVFYKEYNPDLKMNNSNLEVPELPSRFVAREAVAYALELIGEDIDIDKIANNDITIGQVADACSYYILIGDYLYKEDEMLKKAVYDVSNTGINKLKINNENIMSTDDFKKQNASQEDVIFLVYEIIYNAYNKDNEIINDNSIYDLFEDADSVSDWAKEAVKVLHSKDAYSGTVNPEKIGKGRVINPKNSAKVKFLISLMERHDLENFQFQNIPNMINIVLERTKKIPVFSVLCQLIVIILNIREVYLMIIKKIGN